MQPGMNSDFEMFRRERNMRRQQVKNTERPAGNKDVWAQLEARERTEFQDRILNAEVDDFFSEATRLAAEIVKRVTDNREQEISDKLIQEMEEFLFESIRHATNMVSNLDCESARRVGAAETTVDANMKNLDGSELDEFRAEGTAQLRDKHFGQDPFSSGVDLSRENAGSQETETSDEEPAGTAHQEIEIFGGDISDADSEEMSERMHISDRELTLEFDSDTHEGFAAPGFESGLSAAGDPGESIPLQQSGELVIGEIETSPVRDELSVASHVAIEADEGECSDVAVEEESEFPNEDAPRSVQQSRDNVRAALLLLVKQGVMTKDQARAAYRARTQSGD